MSGNYENMGTWWNDRSIEVIKLNGKMYALNGWNGEAYVDSWEVAKNLIDIVDDRQYIIKPIYEEVKEDEFTLTGYEVLG